MHSKIKSLYKSSRYINQVVILGTSIFQKSKKTVESNHSTDRVRINRLPSYFAVAAWTSIFTFTMIWTGRVRSKNGFDLVEVRTFYKPEKTSSQTVRPKNIKTAALLYLIMAA